MGKMTILSKSSNNVFSYTDSADERLTVYGNFEFDEQNGKVLSANGEIKHDGAQIGTFNTQMLNGELQYQLYGATADNTENVFAALRGVQGQLKELVGATAESTAPTDADGNGEAASEAASDTGTGKEK